MTEEEKKAQYTGYSIDAGNVGYLRASIGMMLENRILRFIFPEKYWEGEELPYDFLSLENQSRFLLVVKKYLEAIKSGRGKEIADSLPKLETEKQGDMIEDFFTKFLQADRISKAEGCLENKGALMWVKSLFEFYLLGIKKQKLGLNPKIYISW
jgi:hypothetical protein